MRETPLEDLPEHWKALMTDVIEDVRTGAEASKDSLKRPKHYIVYDDNSHAYALLDLATEWAIAKMYSTDRLEKLQREHAVILVAAMMAQNTNLREHVENQLKNMNINSWFNSKYIGLKYANPRKKHKGNHGVGRSKTGILS